MKKFFLLLLFVAPTLMFSQKSAGKLSRTDKLTKTIESLASDYETNSFVIYEKILSDNAVVYLNNTKTDGKTVKAGFRQHHEIFNDIKISNPYSHTNYFNDGEVWTNNWFTWTGTGNTTGIRYTNKAHFDFKWENGVVVELGCYFDSKVLEMELAAAAAAGN